MRLTELIQSVGKILRTSQARDFDIQQRAFEELVAPELQMIVH